MIEIIAELANAHQSDPSIALELAIAAKESGADAVKFQIYFPEELLVKNHPRYGHFKSLAFSETIWNNLLKKVKEQKIKIYADIFGLKAFEIAFNNDLDGFKVHTSDLLNIKLLDKLAYQDRKVFLGTGGSTILEIKYALDQLKRFLKPSEIILMHGFQAYPTQIEDAAISKIGKLKELFGDLIRLGYSDHSDADSEFATILPIMCIPYGISYIEKHLIFNRSKKGTDYFSSLEPEEFRKFIQVIRLAEKAIGVEQLKFSLSEKKYRKNCKKAWVANKYLKPGSVIKEKDLEMKRVPNFTITPTFEEIKNSVLLRAKKKESPITRLDLKHRILAIIVARSDSSRLPNKATLDINGRPAISHLFERIKIIKNKGYIDTVAFCTSIEECDDKLVNIAKDYSFKIYRGAKEDVLSRMMLAVDDNPECDIILRITGDDMLIDSEYAKKAIIHHLKTCADYTDTKKLPSGLDIEIFNSTTLRLIWELSKDTSKSEYLTNYIRENEGQFNTTSLPVDKKYFKKYRLTLDTIDDFQVVKRLLNYMRTIGKEYTYTLDDIYDFFRKYPAVSHINASAKQKTTPVSINTEIDWQAITKGPLVTVYITNHNYSKYIKQSIGSVLSQKFRSFELIIIDDGSTDSSRDVIEIYRGNPKVKIVYQQNKGLNVSNNIAINLSRGKYIIRLDADDYLDENALLIMTNKLERDNELNLVFPDYYLVDEKGEVFSHERRHNFQQVTAKDRPAHGACTMIRKEALIEVGGYCEDFKCQDGYDIWVKFIDKFKIANINLPLFYYRQHERNLTRNQEEILATRHEIIKKHTKKLHIKGKKHIGIIPIRGGEKDTPFALRGFVNTTLLDIAIKNTLKTENISKIILTTPDDRIINYAKEIYKDKIIVDKRPQEFSALNTRMEETVNYLIRQYQHCFDGADTITIMGFEYPLRKHIFIDKAINSLYLFATDSVLSVKQRNANFFRHEGLGLVPFESNRELTLERDIIFEETGGIHTVKYDSYLRHRSWRVNKIGHIIIDDLSAIRLSNELDFEIAEYFYRKRYS